ncbi:MAG TPA: hypothetical protein VMT10_01905 [Solirubrobacteraceae bacterium]|nr:hypothetical protein [Solirubrobacteraceae bacterium]
MTNTRLPASRPVLVAAVVCAAALALAAGALAAATKPVVGAAQNAQLHKRIVVTRTGVTLYRLAPETTRHLLCTSASCLQAWPPLTVASASTKLVAGAGVHGKLGLLKRGRVFQVTLRGLPLYRFVGDSGKGQANGEGLKSFGGTWHVVPAAG